jgi:hypothetical protein
MAIGDSFNIARATAINTVVCDLERMLALLFSKLLGANEQKSYIVFAALQNYRSRREILTRLMSETYGNRYKIFFKTLMAQLTNVESNRNKIVHWIVLTSRRGRKPIDPETDVNLHEHPNMYGDKKLSKKDVEAFTEYADFVRILVYYLNYGSEIDEDGKWRQIFNQRVVYPPPKDHPILHRRKESSQSRNRSQLAP